MNAISETQAVLGVRRELLVDVGQAVELATPSESYIQDDYLNQ